MKIICPTIYPWWNARLEWLLLCEPRKVERLFKNNPKKLYQELKEAVQRAVDYQLRLDPEKWEPDQIAEIVMQMVAPADVDPSADPIPEDLENRIRAWAREPPEGEADPEKQHQMWMEDIRMQTTTE